MSHKQAKLARKMFPELGSKHRREQERLKSEALAKAVKIREEARAELAGDNKPAAQRVAHIDSPQTSSLMLAALIAGMGGGLR